MRLPVTTVILWVWGYKERTILSRRVKSPWHSLKGPSKEVSTFNGHIFYTYGMACLSTPVRKDSDHGCSYSGDYCFSDWLEDSTYWARALVSHFAFVNNVKHLKLGNHKSEIDTAVLANGTQYQKGCRRETRQTLLVPNDRIFEQHQSCYALQQLFCCRKGANLWNRVMIASQISQARRLVHDEI